MLNKRGRLVSKKQSLAAQGRYPALKKKFLSALTTEAMNESKVLSPSATASAVEAAQPLIQAAAQAGGYLDSRNAGSRPETALSRVLLLMLNAATVKN